MSDRSKATVEDIDAVDAFASTLFLRAAQSSDPAFKDVASAVRQLHLALRHLRIEAAVPDSLLRSDATPEASIFSRQLRPLIDDCSFALAQLKTVLDKYDNDAVRPDDVERLEKIAAIRGKLASERTNVELFLDTVQLQNTPTAIYGAPVNSRDQSSLEGIKDKVDAIADRLFQRHDSGFADGFDGRDDGLWQDFEVELEKEGFSPAVLRKHKDVLRAYIRELEATSSLNGGAPPPVRRLLERESRSAMNTKEVMRPDIDGEKYFPTMKSERRMPELAPARTSPILLPPPPHMAYDSHSGDGSDDAGSDASGESMALISTKELMAMDSLANGVADMQLQPQKAGQHYITSSAQQKYLPSNVAGTLPAPPEMAMSSSPNTQLLGASPRFVPPLGPEQTPPPAYSSSPQRSRLGPDRFGKEIPLEAQWTRIKRSIVSPEVLERAGVRYEARPDYVAVLGRLSRAQIEGLARQSADCRAARSGRMPPQQPRYYEREQRERADSKSSREDEDEESVLWDESDYTDEDDDRTSEKGHKSYPYIVSPPEKEKTSPHSKAMPKPILKNKNENHVRFDPEPHEVDSRSPRSRDDYMSSRRKDSSRRPSHSHRDGRYSDRRSGGSDRDRPRDRDRHSDSHGRSSHHRDKDKKTDNKKDKKKAWEDTLGAVGIGGAAVSLLGVLAEAAGQM